MTAQHVTNDMASIAQIGGALRGSGEGPQLGLMTMRTGEIQAVQGGLCTAGTACIPGSRVVGTDPGLLSLVSPSQTLT